MQFNKLKENKFKISLFGIAYFYFYRLYRRKCKELWFENDFPIVFPEIFYPYRKRYNKQYFSEDFSSSLKSNISKGDNNDDIAYSNLIQLQMIHNSIVAEDSLFEDLKVLSNDSKKNTSFQRKLKN